MGGAWSRVNRQALEADNHRRCGRERGAFGARLQSENDENQHPSVGSLQLSVKHLQLLIKLASDDAFRASLIESSTARKLAVDFLNQAPRPHEVQMQHQAAKGINSLLSIHCNGRAA